MGGGMEGGLCRTLSRACGRGWLRGEWSANWSSGFSGLWTLAQAKLEINVLSSFNCLQVTRRQPASNLIRPSMVREHWNEGRCSPPKDITCSGRAKNDTRNWIWHGGDTAAGLKTWGHFFKANSTTVPSRRQTWQVAARHIFSSSKIHNGTVFRRSMLHRPDSFNKSLILRCYIHTISD